MKPTGRLVDEQSVRAASADRRAVEALVELELRTARGRHAIPKWARVLTVACPKDHRLAWVVRTRAGLIIMGLDAETLIETFKDEGEEQDEAGLLYHWEVERQRHTRHNRVEAVCIFLDSLKRRPDEVEDSIRRAEGAGGLVLPHRVVQLQCRCRTVQIWGEWFEGHIAAGHRRAIFDGERPSTGTHITLGRVTRPAAS